MYCRIADTNVARGRPDVKRTDGLDAICGSIVLYYAGNSLEGHGSFYGIVKHAAWEAQLLLTATKRIQQAFEMVAAIVWDLRPAKGRGPSGTTERSLDSYYSLLENVLMLEIITIRQPHLARRQVRDLR